MPLALKAKEVQINKNESKQEFSRGAGHLKKY